MDNPKKPWYASKKIIILIVIVVLAIIGQFTNSSDKVEKQPVAEQQYLSVYDLLNITFYDEEDKVWYWGVNFKTDQPPSTKLNCEVNALNKAGETVVSEQHNYNLGNEGFVVRYGSDDLPTTTKEIAEAINTFEVLCIKL